MTVVFRATELSLADLVDSWAVEVVKFESELDKHWSDADGRIWGADELLGTFSLRDAIEHGLAELEAVAGTREIATLEIVDNLLRSFTVEDRSTPLFSSGGEDGAWWWTRIPVRGPVPEELAERSRRGAT